jgi:Carboxypeptidase regulatory-like domain
MPQSKKLGLALVLLTVVLSMFSAAWAQEVTAAIVGTVTDPSGAPIKGATVVANDTERGTLSTATTNDSGSYNLARLPVGSYGVKVSAPGFDTALHPPFTLLLNQTARVDVQMQVGKVSETVEVTTTAPILKTETTEVDTVIDSRTNDNLPLATRNPVQLTLLAPGAVTVDTASFNYGSNTAEGGGRPYINGNREQANNFILDGMDNNQVSENRLGLTPSPDAIQEFNLITQNASAEFGNFEGGIVNTTIKSGTNSFHGDVFEFFRNDIFNANKWENGLTAGKPAIPGQSYSNGVLLKPTLRWNMFGGTIGGPIVKNKLFFFGDYQGGRLDHPATPTCGAIGAGACTTLTSAEAGGNFGALLNLATPVQLFNPCAAGTGVSGTPCQLVPAASRVPFVGNVIPAGMLDPAFTKLVTSSMYPLGSPSSNGFGTANDLFGQQFNSNQFDVKVDYNASARDRLSGRFSWGHQNDPASNSFGLLGAQTAVAHLKNGVLDWTHMFSPSLLNDARFGFNWVSFENNNYTFNQSTGSLAGGLGINGVSSAGLPLFGFGGGTITNQPAGTLTNLGNATALENFASTVIQFNDNLSYTHGKHVIRTGFQMDRYRINVFYAGNGGELGMLLYNGQYTGPVGAAGAAAAASAAADFALGLPSLVGHGVSSAAGGGWHQLNWLYAGYVQDNWRATNSLTLNLGLRYEARTPWIEENNRQVNVNILTGALEYPGNTTVVGVGTNGFSRGLYNSVYGLPDFQPRIGFAWSPAFLDNKTVVRGAYSISSYLEGTGTNLRLTQNPPNTPPQSQDTNLQGSGTPFTTEAGPVAGTVIGGNPFTGATMLAWSKTVQPAIAQQWNFTIQQSLSHDTTFQIGYVGQHGTHQMVPEWLTQAELTPNGTSNCTLPNKTTTPCSYPFVGGINSDGTFGPNHLGGVKDTVSEGAMRYNALQAVLQKRYGHGLEAQVSYTFSKCMTDSSGYFGTWSSTTQTTPASPYFQNLYNPGAEWARCYWDTTHVVSAYAVYELPFGHGKTYGNSVNPVVNAVAGGWSVNPIISWHTGFPLALYGTDESGTGSQGARPNCNGSPSYPKTTSSAGQLWYNPSFLSNPAPGTFGDCPAQGPVVGPGYSDIDLGLQKNFPFGEVRRLQFRTDFLNLANHANFSKPGGNGLITSTQDSREIQFALKFYF